MAGGKPGWLQAVCGRGLSVGLGRRALAGAVDAAGQGMDGEGWKQGRGQVGWRRRPCGGGGRGRGAAGWGGGGGGGAGGGCRPGGAGALAGGAARAWAGRDGGGGGTAEGKPSQSAQPLINGCVGRPRAGSNLARQP